jgi:hypothetical protein
MATLATLDTALQTIARYINEIKDNYVSYAGDTSLAEVTKLMRVEPLFVISRDCMSLEYMPDIAQSMLSQFCGYYLQAVHMLTRVDHVQVVRTLDRLNPDRDETGFLLSEKVSREELAMEQFCTDNYKLSLPTPRTRMALETTAGDMNVENSDARNMNEKTLLEAANLSVGKLLKVNVTYTGDTLSEVKQPKDTTTTLDINVRLMASFIPSDTLRRLMTVKKEDTSITERWHSFRSGRISFINDLIFCQDLIDEYKKATINDSTGTMAEILRRASNAKKFGILTKNPSLVASSNLFCISEEIARQIESDMGGKLSNPNIRKKVFEGTYAMIIAVVDREYKRVTFYTRGISSSTDVSVQEMKTVNKGQGADIMDILKSYNLGQPASF